MEPSLVAENLTKKFGSTIAVSSISFNAEKGEFFCMIGPSGCGKTTTLRLIAGLIRPDSGKIYINGKDYTDVPTYKRPLSMVFQTWALFPHMSVYDNVAFGLRMHNATEQKVREEVGKALKLVRMDQYADRRPRELSGGQQQRVGLARALVIGPEILLLDEPLGNLDFKLQLQMQVELKQLHRELGITFVYVTHDQRQAMALGNRIMVMNNGQIEQLDVPIKVYSNPTSLFVGKFVGESNTIEGKVRTRDTKEVTVETDLGEFKVLGNNLSVGQRVWILLRPEVMFVGPEAMNSDYVLDGTLVSTISTGPETQYLVDVKGTEFKIRKQGIINTGAEENATPSQRIKIGFNKNDAVVLSRISLIESANVESAILGL
jgi:spermidine/putrescine transport system ATP-binding protein